MVRKHDGEVAKVRTLNGDALLDILDAGPAWSNKRPEGFDKTYSTIYAETFDNKSDDVGADVHLKPAPTYLFLCR